MDMLIETLADPEENPRISVRKISDVVRIGTILVWRILHEQLLYPYHIQRVQVLSQLNYQARIEFLQWLLVKFASNQNFLFCILFTDEVLLTRNENYLNLVILPSRLSGATYLNFLVNTLCQYLDDIPFHA
uniref:Uncharacterized protein n=1 Tax=Vespula pensylvanica TaxID=30213 RepID=A0A834NR46_VESPE|nr:hypothetical protein H0235_012591 [Vespula pensylvanica]